MSTPSIRFAERHVLLWIMAGTMLAFAVAILVLALRQGVQPANTVKRPIVLWIRPDRPSPQQLEADLMDPSLLSLPNLQGYSRALWQRGAPARHRSLAPGVELAYLEPTVPAAVGVLLPQPVLADAVRWTVSKPPVDPLETAPVEPVEAPLALTQSVLQVEGDLAGRWVVSQPAVPVINAPAGLRPSLVRIGVSPDGTVRYAVLQRSSGAEEVDRRAVALAREVRFAPQNRPQNQDLAWALARFVWHTQIETTGPAPGN